MVGLVPGADQLEGKKFQLVRMKSVGQEGRRAGEQGGVHRCKGCIHKARNVQDEYGVCRCRPVSLASASSSSQGWHSTAPLRLETSRYMPTTCASCWERTRHCGRMRRVQHWHALPAGTSSPVASEVHSFGSTDRPSVELGATVNMRASGWSVPPIMPVKTVTSDVMLGLCRTASVGSGQAARITRV